MPNPCYYYKKEGLRCVIELSISYYAFYIQLKLRCSYVFSNTKRGKIKRKKKKKQTLLLRAKVEALRANAKAAQLRLKLISQRRNSLQEKEKKLMQLRSQSGQNVLLVFILLRLLTVLLALSQILDCRLTLASYRIILLLLLILFFLQLYLRFFLQILRLGVPLVIVVYQG